jgi:hypothetical protein
MMAKKKVAYPDVNHLTILKPDPIIYGGKIYETEINLVLRERLENNPVQMASIYLLEKIHLYDKSITNPLGRLMITLFNQETPDNLHLRMSVSEDMENMALKLDESTAEFTNWFLFTNQDIDLEEQERIASSILLAKNDDELVDILISELLYGAMVRDDWPPPRF